MSRRCALRAREDSMPRCPTTAPRANITKFLLFWATAIAACGGGGQSESKSKSTNRGPAGEAMASSPEAAELLARIRQRFDGPGGQELAENMAAPLLPPSSVKSFERVGEEVHPRFEASEE